VMMNAKKKIWKERCRAVANYPHSIGNVQGPIDDVKISITSPMV